MSKFPQLRHRKKRINSRLISTDWNGNFFYTERVEKKGTVKKWHTIIPSRQRGNKGPISGEGRFGDNDRWKNFGGKFFRAVGAFFGRVAEKRGKCIFGLFRPSPSGSIRAMYDGGTRSPFLMRSLVYLPAKSMHGAQEFGRDFPRAE